MADDILSQFAEFLKAKSAAEADADDFGVNMRVTGKDGTRHEIEGVPWSKIPKATLAALGLEQPEEGGGDGGTGTEGEAGKGGAGNPLQQIAGFGQRKAKTG